MSIATATELIAAVNPDRKASLSGEFDLEEAISCVSRIDRSMFLISSLTNTSDARIDGDIMILSIEWRDK